VVALQGGGEVFHGSVPKGSLAMLSAQYDSRWRLAPTRGSSAGPARAFGWADGWSGASGAVEIRYGAQWIRTLEMLLLTIVWAASLWITRRPARRG